MLLKIIKHMIPYKMSKLQYVVHFCNHKLSNMRGTFWRHRGINYQNCSKEVVSQIDFQKYGHCYNDYLLSRLFGSHALLPKLVAGNVHEFYPNLDGCIQYAKWEKWNIDKCK